MSHHSLRLAACALAVLFAAAFIAPRVALAGDGVLCGTFQIPYNVWQLRPSNQAPGTYRQTCNATKSQHLLPAVTALDNGNVLVTGGMTGLYYDRLGHDDYYPTNAAELYDVVASRFVNVRKMKYIRGSHAAIPLPNHKVLILGGSFVDNGGGAAHPELFNPKTLSFDAAGALVTPRYGGNGELDTFAGFLFFAAASLADGRVLVTGGATAELYDPATNAFTATNPPVFYRDAGTAVTLRSGKVLVMGGASTPNVYPQHVLDLAELYDPSTGTFSYAATMIAPRGQPTATLLNDDKVLVASGNSAELYDPIANVFVPAGPVASVNGPAVLLRTGKVLFPADAQIYDPATNTFSAVSPLLPTPAGKPLRGVSAALISNDQVLVVGGGPNGSTNTGNSAGVPGQLYQP